MLLLFAPFSCPQAIATNTAKAANNTSTLPDFRIPMKRSSFSGRACPKPQPARRVYYEWRVDGIRKIRSICEADSPEFINEVRAAGASSFPGVDGLSLQRIGREFEQFQPQAIGIEHVG